MSNSGGHAVTRIHGSDRFYSPPAARRNQQLLLRQRPLKSNNNNRRAGSVEPDARADSDESTLSRPNSICSSSPPRTPNLTNLDRVMNSLSPFVRAQLLSEPRMRTPDGNPYFFLGDLWESLREWSAYGVEVPLILNGRDSIKQYYVPYLSGIQLYVEPHKPRRHSEDSDAEPSRETGSAGSSDCEVEKRASGGVDGASMQNSFKVQRLSKLTLRDRPPLSSCSDETDVCKSPGLLAFEYFEQIQPHFRPPIYDKVSILASQFPDLMKYRSCDLLPSSWLSVAWYPIYRIPIASTLRSLDASFLTFHSLSTHSKSKHLPQFHPSCGSKVHGVDGSLNISLPAFALASYKLRGSILNPNGASEWQQANSLLQAADDWLRHLQVKHHDYQYFISHGSQWR